MLGFAIPGFLIALGLVLVFAINLGWFEPTGYIQFSELAAGLAVVDHPAGHRAGARRHRRRLRSRSAAR